MCFYFIFLCYKLGTQFDILLAKVRLYVNEPVNCLMAESENVPFYLGKLYKKYKLQKVIVINVQKPLRLWI